MNLFWGKKIRAPWGTPSISEAMLLPMRMIISSLLSLYVEDTVGSMTVLILSVFWIGGYAFLTASPRPMTSAKRSRGERVPDMISAPLASSTMGWIAKAGSRHL